MSEIAFFEADAFAVGRALVAARAAILPELRALTAADFVDWPARAAYSSGWQVFAIRMPRPPAGLVFDPAEAGRRCPQTVTLLRSLPAVQLAGVSRLLPGCHIFPHRDDPEPGVLRFHMGVRIEPNSGMRGAGKVVQWQAGEAFVFDHSHMHEAANLGAEPRDVLLVDFRLTADESAAVARLRAGAGGGEGP
jgi:murein DD-endopeptidase MepM/ murein hydrolase activator NlpD